MIYKKHHIIWQFTTLKSGYKKRTALNEGVQYSNISNSNTSSVPQSGENANGNRIVGGFFMWK